MGTNAQEDAGREPPIDPQLRLQFGDQSTYAKLYGDMERRRQSYVQEVIDFFSSSTVLPV